MPEADLGSVTFPNLSALEGWGNALGDAVVSSVKACRAVVDAFARRQATMRDAVATGKAAPREGPLTAYREALAGNLIMDRLRGSARRLDVLCHLVELSAPMRGKPSQPAKYSPLWPIVARSVKHDLAAFARCCQVDTAMLHGIMIPVQADPGVGSPDRRRVAAGGTERGAGGAGLILTEDTLLADTDFTLVQSVCQAHELHTSQYLAICQDAVEVVAAAIEARVRLDADSVSSRNLTGPDTMTVLPALTGMRLPMSPKKLADGLDDTVTNTNPDVVLGEDNPRYSSLLARHGNPALEQLGAAVGRTELLSPIQVDLINTELADAVVGTFHLYNGLVATFTDYEREAGRFHRVRSATDSLEALAWNHLAPQGDRSFTQAARIIAVTVGETVAGIDGCLEDIDALRRWAPQCVDDSIPDSGGGAAEDVQGLISESSFRRTLRLATTVPTELRHLLSVLTHLVELCRHALLSRCEPMGKLIQQTLDAHAAGLLPFAQALAVVSSDLRSLDTALTRELGQLKLRMPDACTVDQIGRWLLQRGTPRGGGAADGDSDSATSLTMTDVGTINIEPHEDPLRSARAIHTPDCQRRCDVITAILINVKNAVMQVPPSLSSLLRVLSQPISLRPRQSRIPGVSLEDPASDGIRGALKDEVAHLRVSLDEAQASLAKHKAAARVSKAVDATSEAVSPAVKHADVINHVSVEVAITRIVNEALIPSNSERLATAGGSPQRSHGLTSDQQLVVKSLRALVALLAATDKTVVELAAAGFASEGDASLQNVQRNFTALVGVVESLGQHLYLDMEVTRRIGGL